MVISSCVVLSNLRTFDRDVAQLGANACAWVEARERVLHGESDRDGGEDRAVDASHRSSALILSGLEIGDFHEMSLNS